MSSQLPSPVELNSAVKHERGDSYRLLSISPSDESEDIPDLNLVPPPVADQRKRKVRLKRRRQRGGGGRLSSAGSGSQASSGALELWRVCTRCCSASVCAAVVTVAAMIVVSYVAAQAHVRIAKMELELENVIGDRKELKEKFQTLQSQLQGIRNNETQLQLNVSLWQANLTALSIRLSGFNRSVSSIISSLASAPGLKDLPQDVEQINVDLAKFGSRLTEVESKMLKPDLNAADRVQQPNDNATLQHLRQDLDSLDSRLQQAGTRIEDQLRQLSGSTKEALKMIEQLQKEYQNLISRMDDVDEELRHADA